MFPVKRIMQGPPDEQSNSVKSDEDANTFKVRFSIRDLLVLTALIAVFRASANCRRGL